MDGSVTYHGNGDGTIHVYNVPLRWDSADDIEKGVMREVTESIIKTEKQCTLIQATMKKSNGSLIS